MKCLIVDEIHPSIFNLLESIGFTYDYFPKISKEEILLKIHLYDGIFVRSKVYIDKEFLAIANQLKFIARAGAGIDNIDMDALENTSIVLVNAPEGNRDAVAEHVIGLVLCLLNHIRKGDTEVKNNIWDREGNRGYELHTKKVGIIGYGFMGKATAQRFAAMGCEVFVYDKYKTDFSFGLIKEVSLETLFEEVDVVSIHIPLTAETKFMINTSFFNKFKKNIWFVNSARGEIVVLKDLVEQLQTGKIIGAGLDVLENEKINQLKDEQKNTFELLKSLPNVILTPHVGGWSMESYDRINKVLIHKIKRAFKL